MEVTTGAIDVEERDGIVRARGLPYGRAERFAAGRPVDSWSGRHDGTRPGPACPQRAGRLDFVTGPLVDGLRFDEDCLVLSVTAPRDAVSLPVMVWFHGGAYVAGGGEAPKYDPAPLVRAGNVVVVTVTYRLGIFGYLAPAEAGADDNIGLRDQILALRWVRENVTAFGGNPDDVTVFGQSAGGDSVIALMVSDGTEDLFHRVIAQSSPLAIGTGTSDTAAGRSAMAIDMQAAMSAVLDGVAPRDADVELLLQAEAAAVQAARRTKFLGAMAFAPRLGRYPLPSADTLHTRLAEAAQRCELLIGYTRNDGAPFIAMQPRIAALRPDYVRRQAIRVASRSLTTRVFARSCKAFAHSWRIAGGRAATYRVDWAPAGSALGACHCIELPHLFGDPHTWADAPMLGTARRPDEALAQRMRSTWTAFAHGGLDALPAAELQFGQGPMRR
ncbi:para-nitrobenzyl esterase [Mycolicibacterium iranicum]|uniref:Carboxylic ester hydrolase n=1 Tax=Mycolicibacterium iranicum TaxID=912594 RepID=A0A839PXE1_MYCIR|nr:carboxylesterase family protein [Mycolicibacterium iranicum]MBB2988858.1 para-nitrobenzyl esterase [Mycolicibacterium iranicum]